MLQELKVLSAMVRTLEQRLEQNETKLHTVTDELSDWKRRAHAHCPKCAGRSIAPRPHRIVSFGERPLPEAIMMCLYEYDHPIGIRTLREKLEELGYPIQKLGRYGNSLRTAVSRLAEAGKLKRWDADEISAF